MKKSVMPLFLLSVLSIFIFASPLTVYGQPVALKIPVEKGPLNIINKHFSTQTTTYSDGIVLERSIINGPPKPPPGYERERAHVSLPKISVESMVGSLPQVPAFRWVFGCSAVSGAMIAGYYDRTDFPNIYKGPTDDGMIPIVEDAAWGIWPDRAGDTYPDNPLIASHFGLDERKTYGSIDDYWYSYLSGKDDPYITEPWSQHAWGDAIGDFMKTSQSAYGNDDGSTSFYSYSSSATPLSCSAMEGFSIADEDGTYGRKLFYEAKGYTVTDCYAQATDNAKRGGFSFAQFKAEIDAGRPVLLNLQGHSIVGVGYDDSTKTVYIHDTWDNNDHTMIWGTSYSGMKLLSVSIVNLAGNVIRTPDISVSPGSYNFVNINIGDTSTKTFTVSNTGSADLSIGTIAIADTSEFSITGACSTPIAPSSSCTFQAQFSPLSAGAKSATITIQSNDPDENPLNISLTGTGVDGTAVDLLGSWSNVTWTGPKRGVYTVSGTFTVTNASQMNFSNVQVDFFLSDDGSLSDNDLLVKTYKYKVLSANSSKATSIRFTTTSSPAGRHLIAFIDSLKSIAESDESNNLVDTSIP
ncbi:MAG: choice-of-anchor D domain-containing protein [Syntrophobacterales bacterium]|nr:choice-of-anchor D domain-containing protein [Syntrophobacterales bacterium]